MHHLSIDDGWILAVVRGCRMWVVGLSCHRLYGNELQGARGGIIWIWRTKRELTHTETTNTSNHYIVSQRGRTCHTSLLSLSRSLSFSQADNVELCQTSVMCQQRKRWTETIDLKDSNGFKACASAHLWYERAWLCTFITYPTSDDLDSILAVLNPAVELFKPTIKKIIKYAPSNI